jgi:UDP-4-amino-4,6-dideoxy-N-acetyl-beta-L-altrosamine N-acetyltransferase
MRLRLMEDSDVQTVRRWRNHPDVRRNMYTQHEISAEEHESWWSKVRDDLTRRYLIMVDDHGTGYGAVNFTNINTTSGTADWAFYSADTNRKGIGSMMERKALEYAFSELALRKLSCEVLSFNQRVIGLHRRHGFLVEGVFKNHFVGLDGTCHDVYRLALTKKDWETIKEVGTEWVGKYGSKYVEIREQHIYQFSHLTGDHNPIHNLGPDQIAHGLLTASTLSALIGNDFPGHGTVYLRQDLNFRKPVRPGQKLKVVAEVITQIGRKLYLNTTIYDQDTRDVMLDGEALVYLKGDAL